MSIFPTMRDAKGFTLIELLIVVVIIGILAAIAIPQFSSTKDTAYIGQVKSDVRNALPSLESHYVAEDTYDPATGTPDIGSSENVTLSVYGDGSNWCVEGNHDEATGVDSYAASSDPENLIDNGTADTGTGQVIQGSCSGPGSPTSF